MGESYEISKLRELLNRYVQGDDYSRLELDNLTINGQDLTRSLTDITEIIKNKDSKIEKLSTNLENSYISLERLHEEIKENYNNPKKIKEILTNYEISLPIRIDNHSKTQ